MPKVALHTLGCKLNFSETSTIGKQFLNNGFEIVDFNNIADVYVFNTCTVTENAEKDCRQLIRHTLKKNPNAYIIVTGCYAQLKPDEIAQINGVDLVLGNQEKFDVFSYLKTIKKSDYAKKDLALNSEKNLACIYVSQTEQLNDFGWAHSSEADSRTRAYMKIQDGCDYKCSFCTIPLARGKSRSLEIKKIIEQFKHILDEGYKEIILTGVNVGDYGKKNNSNLYELLSKLISIEGEFRIRISSIEPNLLSDEILELTKSSEKICKHFHIPLQSGSNKILKLMQRRYISEYYCDLIFKAKEIIPDLGIGVDVIVGFPGETDADFLETEKFIEQLPISYLHVFTYSERPNTKAINISDSVDIATRKKRNHILRNLSDKKRRDFLNSMLDKNLKVLFEHENYEGMMKGYSSNYIRITVPFDEDLINHFVDVKIDRVGIDSCIGKLEKENYILI